MICRTGRKGVFFDGNWERNVIVCDGVLYIQPYVRRVLYEEAQILAALKRQEEAITIF